MTDIPKTITVGQLRAALTAASQGHPDLPLTYWWEDGVSNPAVPWIHHAVRMPLSLHCLAWACLCVDWSSYDGDSEDPGPWTRGVSGILEDLADMPADLPVYLDWSPPDALGLERAHVTASTYVRPQCDDPMYESVECLVLEVAPYGEVRQEYGSYKIEIPGE